MGGGVTLKALGGMATTTRQGPKLAELAARPDMTRGELAGRAADRLGRRSVDVGHRTSVQASAYLGRHGSLVLSAMALAVYSIAPTIRAFALAALEKVSKGLATKVRRQGAGQHDDCYRRFVTLSAAHPKGARLVGSRRSLKLSPGRSNA